MMKYTPYFIIPKKNSLFLLIFIALHISFSYAQFTPGTSYFSSNGYIEYIAGNLPIVLSAPHGGYLKPAGIPSRTCSVCDTTQDAYTQEFARELKDSIYRLYGGYPHLVINLLHRAKLDANREIVEAAQGNATAEASWYAFQSFIDTAEQQIVANGQKGIYIDLHGHGHAIQRVELGYLLSQSQTQQSDSIINTNTYVNESGIRYLINHNKLNLTHADLLRGTYSFGTMLANRGYPAVPSTAIPYAQTGDAYFDGGYNTSRHGSDSAGNVDGFQMEMNQTVRFTTSTRQSFAKAVALCINDYTNTHFITTNITSTSTGGNWSATSTWVGGVVPTLITNVVIANNATVTIDNATATCASISFGSNTARLAMGASTSALSVYGDFTIFSTTHNVFSSWVSGAKIWFKGNAATQTLTGWNTSGNSTVFMEMKIDKAIGRVNTSGAGMRFCIGTSLEIVNGSFELSSADDIEFKDLSYNGTTGTITVQSGGIFNLLGGNSHIRRGTFTGDESSKIGKLTVYGTAYIGSSNATQRLNFGGIDIENGGLVEIATSRSTAAAVLNCGTITVKNGGVFKNSLSNVNYWYQGSTNTTALVVNSGGIYSSYAGTTIAPTVCTLLSGSTVAFLGSGTQTLPSAIATYQNLTLNNNGTIVSGNTNIAGTLTLTAGSLAIGANTLNIAGSISRATGTIDASNGATIGFTGIGLQSIPVNTYTGAINNCTINNSNGVTINDNLTIIGNLALTNGALNVGSNTLVFHSGNTPITRTAGSINVTTSSNISFGLTGNTGGNAFIIPDNTFVATPDFNTLTINRDNALTLNNQNMSLRGKLKLTAGTLILPANYTFILKSTGLLQTTQVDAVGSSANIQYGTGAAFQVERYIPASKRAYRVIATGVNSGSSTIFDNWQEGGTNSNGYGTHITGLAGALGIDNTTGFDKTQKGTKSLFTYSVDNTTGNAGWVTYTSTKGSNDTISAYKGYLLTIRGNRAYNLTVDNTLMNAPVTLRSRGKLVTGSINYTTSGVTANGVTNNNIRLNSGSATGFTMLGNPYACAINWNSIIANAANQNIENTYWHFDPNVGTVGAYVTYNGIAGVSSNPSGSALNQYIQPGQAFFIKNTSTAPILQIREADKAASSTNTSVFGEGENSNIVFSIDKQIDSQFVNLDGAVLCYKNSFTNALGKEDATKMMNAAENLSIFSNNNTLSIEGRASPAMGDTVQLRLGQLVNNASYRLLIDLASFNSLGLQPILIDSLLQKQIPLTTATKNIYPFTTTNNTNSFANRFSVLFSPIILPYNPFIITGKVSLDNSNVISWQSLDKAKSYQVSYSNDGNHFSVIDTIVVHGKSYSWQNSHPVFYINYYKVTAILSDEQQVISNLVQLTNGNLRTDKCSIYPIPAQKNRVINVCSNSFPQGQYHVSISNSAGKEEQEANFLKNDSSSKYPLKLSGLAAGVYYITISKNDFSIQKSFIVE
ncbi:T9SS type A sorting domain-containing protein [Parasediminibacterium sp. JCM 36343]|uniref:T9SS type A sorting domain-containing protein n=1 Tax=Parasediminibacterium sp. JCM 36343 TaxID=3374279 RepID=UPI00397D3E38